MAALTCHHVLITGSNGQAHCQCCGETTVSFSKDETSFYEDPASDLARDHKGPKTIRKELDLLPIPEDVKELADRIYTEKVGNNTYRSNVRQEVKFTCLYEACKRLGIYMDPREIATMLQIKRKGMSRGILRCSFLCTGKESVDSAPITALHIVPDMLNRNGVDYDQSHLDDITRIYEHAKLRSEMLNRSNPQSIAASLVYYYLTVKMPDRKINKNEVSKQSGISAMTISKLANELGKIVKAAERT